MLAGEEQPLLTPIQRENRRQKLKYACLSALIMAMFFIMIVFPVFLKRYME